MSEEEEARRVSDVDLTDGESVAERDDELSGDEVEDDAETDRQRQSRQCASERHQ